MAKIDIVCPRCSEIRGIRERTRERSGCAAGTRVSNTTDVTLTHV